MSINKENLNYILPVAIMAHNEEKVIKNAIKSALEQQVPYGYSVKVVVVANGCDDRTEEIVKELEHQDPNKVLLVAIKEKGKTRAINRAIGFFDQLSKTGLLIPHVIFLDADCEFNGKEALIKFINRFKQNPRLCAVGADCLPDVFFNGRNDITAEIYRAVCRLGQSVKINSISGMCYGIRLDVLKKMDFPEFHFAEDMFVCSRLNGWFYKDRGIQIVFKIPPNIGSEIKRRTRQEISTQRYHRYYSHLKNKGVRVELFEKALGDDYRWGRSRDDSIVKSWFGLKGVKPKLFVLAYILIKMLSKIKASRKHIKIKDNQDYWKVSR